MKKSEGDILGSPSAPAVLKPSRVEVGQRWRTYCGLDSPEYTWVVRVVEDGKVLFSRPGQEPRPGQKPSTTEEEVLSRYTYLGGPTPPVSPVGPVPARPKPESGQQWRWCKSQLWTMVRLCEDGDWEARDQHGSTGHWSPRMFADVKNGEYVGHRRTPESVPQELTGDVMVGASPKTAPSVSTPAREMCSWKKQPLPGMAAVKVCSLPVSHDRSPYCEAHIFEDMIQRDTEKREARKEPPFQQSHLLGQGAIGIWSLRSENGR